MTRRARHASFVAALAVAGAILLLLVAGVRWNTPLVSAGERAFPGSNFHAVFGDAEQDGQLLRVNAAAEDHSALQTAQVPSLDAAEFPILSYRFDAFPRTLDLSFVFRIEGAEDVETITVPTPANGDKVTFDLSAIPAWKGRIVEIGFAQFPVAQLAPPREAFRAFTLVRAELRGSSWLGQLGALASEWEARSPWQFVSVSALGPSEIGDTTPHVLRLPLFAAIALALAAALAWTILGLRGRAFARFVAIGFAVAWIALDLCWLRDLDYKRRADRDIWSAQPLAQRQAHVADAELLDAATHLKELLRREPRARHILLSTPSPFSAIRFIYHAAPLNISIATALPESLVNGPPPGTIIVKYGMPGGAQDDVLAFGGRRLRVKALEQSPNLSVYRVLGASR